MHPTHSALIVPLPEAEPVVADLRERLDRAASWGVPAHVTVLYPFLPPPRLTPAVLGTVRRLAATVPRFYLTFADVGWFGENVVWLAPDPAEPFRELTRQLAARFPEAPPYGGVFTEVVPHLTVGHEHPVEALRAAADQVRAALPIRARATTLRLIVGRPEPGRPWQTLSDFPLG